MFQAARAAAPPPAPATPPSGYSWAKPDAAPSASTPTYGDSYFERLSASPPPSGAPSYGSPSPPPFAAPQFGQARTPEFGTPVAPPFPPPPAPPVAPPAPPPPAAPSLLPILVGLGVVAALAVGLLVFYALNR
jgi:hypothetical protein